MEYPIKEGLPRLLLLDPAETPEQVAKLERLNALAREVGWESALRIVYEDTQNALRYVTEKSRASFIELLPLTPGSDVLEIGSSLGQFTALLARRARSVCALEVVAGQAEFTLERCRQEGVDNVFVAVGGDECRLPYADGSFDIVVANLVFEWCASRCTDEPIDAVQRRFLDEIYRVSRAGGSLYLATKNRFALRFLVGKRDEHCHGLRFGSAMPRWLVRLLLRRKGWPRPSGMLHSHAGLMAMLRDSGFPRAQSFWAVPEMRYPIQYVPTDAESIRRARGTPGFVQGEMRSTRLMMRFIPAGAVKHFTPGHAFLAIKPR